MWWQPSSGLHHHSGGGHCIVIIVSLLMHHLPAITSFSVSLHHIVVVPITSPSCWCLQHHHFGGGDHHHFDDGGACIIIIFILVVMVIASSRRMVHARVVSGPLPSVHMNTAAMSEIEPGNVLQVSTSLSIFTQPPQVCFAQTIAAGWLREQVLGGGRTLAASGWHVLACVRTRRSLARDNAAFRVT